MNEILKRKRELNEELEKLDKELAKLEQEKFRKKIGKYFRFNLESRYKGYIKIIDLYKLSDNYVIDCVWFGYDTSKARYYNYFSYRQDCPQSTKQPKISENNPYLYTPTVLLYQHCFR